MAGDSTSSRGGGPPIEFVTRRAVAEPTCGGYRSLFKGQGSDFSELRAYEPGDDVRHIDWNVTARSGEPWVRVYEEERELTVFLLVDVSGSMAYGSHQGLKSDSSARLAATLVRSAQRAGDRVGLITFADRVLSVDPPRKGRAHATRLLERLALPVDAGPGTDLRGALHRLLELRRRSAMVFVLSDFAAAPYDDLLRAAAARYDLVPVVLRDRAEWALPSDGLVRLRDAETGALVTIDSSDPAVRRAWQSAAVAEHARRAHLFRALHLSPLELEAADDAVRALSNLMLRRAAGRRP
ncbi:MAG: DUF58 domain-containing protein [Myxococcales bacterium]|nr:DUF58 domain-containing protein [Myxococcales bacterium]